ncbi:serine/threonine protein kinase [Nocardiopsis sp. CNT-189]
MEPLEPSDPAHIGGYRLTHRLGEGGMGRVYLAATPSGRRVAVKVIRPALAREGDFRARFSREIDAARRVGGFHTAPVVDADPEGDPAWVATAYIPGPTLHHAVREEGPIAPPALHALAAGLAEGLKAVHACGLVHRDLKPGNIILGGDGPRIIDFGIARPLDSESLTTREAVFGTLPYMSPEQTENSHVGPASDMFSLGTVLAFAATGTNPFNGDSMAATIRRLIGPPPDPGGIDPGTRALIAECWNHDPDRRPTPEAVLARLGAPEARAAGPPPGTARPPAGGPEAATHPPAPTLVEPARRAPAPRAAAGGRAGRAGGGRRRAAWAAAVASAAIGIAAGAVALRTGGDGGGPGSAPETPEPASILTGHEDPVDTVAFSPDGTVLATSDTGADVRLWDTGTREQATTLIEDDSLLTSGSPVLAFAPDGTALATGGESVRLWDTGTWEEKAALVEEDWITSVAFSPDGDTVAASDPVGRVRLWDTGTGEETASLEGPPNYVTSVAFSPDGTVLATGEAEDTAEVFEDSDGGAVRLWDPGTGDEIDVLVKNGPSFVSVAFSPDGGTLAGCTGTVRIWDTGTWQEDTSLPEVACAISVAFSPDGTVLAAGDHEGAVRLWDTATWQEKTVLPGEERVESVAFGPDGDTLAAGHVDGTVRLWDVG